MTARPSRRGLAPLEFVLVFPLLLALTAGLFLIARADLTKSFAATDARHRAWTARSEVPASEPLVITADPADSLASRTTDRPVPSGPLFAGGFRAESRHAVFAHPWDFRAVPFAGGRPNFDPHRTELGMIAGQVPGLGAILGVGLFFAAYALDPDRNIALRIAAITGRVANVFVVAAGWILQNITAPLIGAAQLPIVNILMPPLRIAAIFSRSARRLLRYLESVVDMMNVGTWACHNLYAASQGRKGNWDGNIFVKLLNFQPR